MTTRVTPLRLSLLFVFALLALLSPPRVAAQPDLAGESVQGPPGGTVTVPFNWTTGQNAAVLQFDLVWDDSVLALGTPGGGSALVSHSLDWALVGPGRARITVVTASVTPLGSGLLASVPFTIADSAPPGPQPVAVEAVIVGSTAAAAITPASLVDGEVVVLDAASVVRVPGVGGWALLLLAGLLAGLAWRRLRSPAALLLLLLGAGLQLLPPAVQAVPGDADNNGRVDAADIPVIVGQILERGLAPGDPDCNADNAVDVLDTLCAALLDPGDGNARDLLPPGDRRIPVDQPFGAQLFASDPDAGDTLTFSLNSGPAGLGVSGAGALQWTPGSADLGPHGVSVSVRDASNRSDTESFTLQVYQPAAVSAANAPPLLGVPADQQLLFDTLLSVTATGSDPDGDSFSFALVNAPAGMSIDAGSGAIVWTPGVAQVGLHDVAVKLSDQHGAVDFGSFTVEVLGENGAPMAVDDLHAARTGESLVVDAPGVLGNDSDPDDDPLTAELLSQPQNGSLAFSADGSFVYAPATPDSENFLQGADLTRYVASGVEASSSFSSSFLPERVADQNLETSWFTDEPPIAEPWVQVLFDAPGVLVREVRLFGNREFATGHDFFRGYVTLLDAADNELWHSGEFDLPDPVRDFVVTVDPPVSDVYKARFTGVDWDGHPTNDPGLSELEVIGDAPVTGLAPTIEWSWTASAIEPTSLRINAPVTVCDLDGDGQPEIVVPTYVGVPSDGVLRAFRGDTGTEVFTYSDIPIQSSSQPACGDIDDDGKLEIIAVTPGATLLALEHDGTLKWQSVDYGSTGGDSTAPALADLDGDGTPEIVIGRSGGITAFDNTGAVIWAASGGEGDVRAMPLS